MCLIDLQNSHHQARTILWSQTATAVLPLSVQRFLDTDCRISTFCHLRNLDRNVTMARIFDVIRFEGMPVPGGSTELVSGMERSAVVDRAKFDTSENSACHCVFECKIGYAEDGVKHRRYRCKDQYESYNI
jgi:hypothetical protein